jgi:predicted deacylase
MTDKQFIPGDVEQVWYRDSDVPGPTALILGGVHGNELPGTEIVKRMVSGELDIPLERGKLIVAIGDVAAIHAGVRLIDSNLNRQFRTLTDDEQERQATKPDYEVGRAQVLLPVLAETDAALDLHAFKPTPNAAPFIITEPRGFDAARAIGTPYISSGWATIEANGTDAYMEELGKVGLCYELAEYEDLKCGIPRGEAGVRRFLEHMQLIAMSQDSHPDYSNPQFVHATAGVLAKPGFRWSSNAPYSSFQRLKPGESIAYNGTEPEDAITAGENQVIIYPSMKVQPDIGDEMFNLGTIIEPPKSKSS